MWKGHNNITALTYRVMHVHQLRTVPVFWCIHPLDEASTLYYHHSGCTSPPQLVITSKLKYSVKWKTYTQDSRRVKRPMPGKLSYRYPWLILQTDCGNSNDWKDRIIERKLVPCIKWQLIGERIVIKQILKALNFWRLKSTWILFLFIFLNRPCSKRQHIAH